MNEFNITDVQLFDHAYPVQINEEGDHNIQYSYSANIVINNEFLVQVSGTLTDSTFEGVAHPNDAFWCDHFDQEMAYRNIDDLELKEYLESQGFENNIGWLEDNATYTANPENSQYRYNNTDTLEDNL